VTVLGEIQGGERLRVVASQSFGSGPEDYIFATHGGWLFWIFST